MALSYARQQPAPEILPTILEEGQRRYLQFMLDRAFGLDGLVEALQEFAREHATTTFKEKELNACMRGIEERIKAELPHSQAFRRQLASLQEAGHMNQLADRLEKARAYFLPKIEHELATLLNHKAQVSGFSKIKTYAEGLDELDQILYHWIQELERSVDLGQRLAMQREVRPNPEIEERRHAWRSTLLETLRQRTAERPVEKPTTGRTRRKKAEKAPKKPKENTYAKTLAMLESGKSPAEVATERMLATSTIEGHLARLIGEGKADIRQYLKAKDIETMAAILSGSESLTHAYQTLAETYSYNQLRMVQAWMEASEQVLPSEKRP